MDRWMRVLGVVVLLCIWGAYLYVVLSTFNQIAMIVWILLVMVASLVALSLSALLCVTVILTD